MVEVRTQQTYTFELTYNGAGGELIVDTVPAEWNILSINGTAIDYVSLPITVIAGAADIIVDQANKKGNKKGSTKIRWEAAAGEMLEVVIQTRGRPSGKPNPTKFAPTSCGVLYLNEDGAEVYAAGDFDPATNMPLEGKTPSFVSNPLYIGAVKDLDGTLGVVGDGSGDEDEDGLTDAEETGYQLDATEVSGTGTSPCDADTDGDGLSDDVEDAGCTDPLDADSDDDGLNDGDEVNTHGTDPCDADTDGDGLDDDVEVAGCTDPLNPDTDGDGLTDGTGEGAAGTNPCLADTDGDTVPDGIDPAPLNPCVPIPCP